MNLEWMPQETRDAVSRLDLSLSVHLVPEVDALLSKTVLFRGKKLRPTLCFLMGRLLGIPLGELGPYARAAEFVHAATLAHDDVIDESSVRRNRPTLNARSSNGRAVLAGDLLLARVMAELSGLGRIEIIHDLAKTVEDLVSGEWLQLEARGVLSVSRLHLETVARKKTASLMIWCCTSPVRLFMGHSERLGGGPLFEAAQGFGESLGVAFQMIDDVIDYDASGEKPLAQDLREGLVNFVTLEMLEYNSDLRHPLQKLLGRTSELDSMADQNRWPWASGELQGAMDRVRSRANAKLEAADQHLSQMAILLAGSSQKAEPSGLDSLRSILVYLKGRIR